MLSFYAVYTHRESLDLFGISTKVPTSTFDQFISELEKYRKSLAKGRAFVRGRANIS